MFKGSLHLNDFTLPSGVAKSFRLYFLTYVKVHVVTSLFGLTQQDFILSNVHELLHKINFGLVNDDVLFSLAVFKGVTHLSDDHIHEYDQVCKCGKEENDPTKIRVCSFICHSKLTETDQVSIDYGIKRFISTDLYNEWIFICHIKESESCAKSEQDKQEHNSQIP